MNLSAVYRDINFRSGTYPDHEAKELFGNRGTAYCRGAAKLAGATPKKGYPYHNEGGVAVWGEVYFYIEHPSNKETLEIILAEMGPYYRTNGPRGYGMNIHIGHTGMFVMGPPQQKVLKEWDEEKLAEVITKFINNGRV